MKKVLLLAATLCLMALPIEAADKTAKPNTKTPNIKASSKASVRPDAESKLQYDKKKASYILGHSLGLRVRKDSEKIDHQAFSRGLSEGLKGQNSKIPPEEARKTMQAFELQAQARARMAVAKAGVENKGAGDRYRAKYQKRKGVKVTKSGLMYRVLKPGKGTPPGKGDTVTTHYTGALVDGTVFSSSVKQGRPANFPLNGVIKGWQEALVMMKPGAKWEIVVPPALAYGPRGAGKAIGPNSTLIFQLELLNVEMPKPAPKPKVKPAPKPYDGAKKK